MAEQTNEQLEQALFTGAMAPPEPAPAPEPEPVAATPEAPETPVVEPTPAPTPEPAPTPPTEAIPAWRLREESEARRQAEDRARQLEERLSQIAAHMQQQPQPKGPDFFENPDAATQAIIQRHLQPYAEATQRQLMYMGKMVASQAHGADKVDAAEQAFLENMRSGALDPSEYERVVQSPNRYDAVVQWHKRQTVLTSVGDDPAAWFEKQLEAKMTDPAFQAKLMEKVRSTAAPKPSTTVLPPSLSRVTAAASNGGMSLGDMSDESLFAHAMKR